MAGLYDGLDQAPGPTAPTPALPKAPTMYEGLEVVPTGGQPAPREASGLAEHLQAGFQASATGLAWRGKLPDLVMNPEHAHWWERAATGAAQVGSELPLMAVGGAAGGAAGTAGGGAVAGPPGAAVGAVLGTGAGMFAVPGAIRESLIQAYKSGEVKTSADWWNILREVATTTAKEGAIGAATFGAGSIAARTLGKAIAPAIGEGLAVGTATKAIGTADVAAQIATMTAMPAAMQGRLPDLQEFMDAAIVIGGLKGAHVAAQRITQVFAKTGKTPAEQVADAQADPKVATDLATPVSVALSGDGIDDLPLRGSAATWATKLPGMPRQVYEALSEINPNDHGAEEEKQLQSLRAHLLEAGQDPQTAMRAVWGEKLADAPPELRQAIERGLALSAASPGAARRVVSPTIQEALFKETARRDELENAAAPLTDAERTELGALRTRIATLEAQAAAGSTQEALPRTYTPEQGTEAKTRAEGRLTELERRSTDGQLTDTERAERVFLTNNMGKTEALARHFGLEPAGGPPSREAHEASAQRVHDNVLEQVREADRAREAAGLPPLGDEHAQAVAALVRARVRTRAARLGVLPEEIYNERPLQIRDETAPQPAEPPIPEAEIPPGAPRFTPPEVDLFGNPIAPETAPRFGVEGMETKEVPLESLTLSKDVPQFKGAADEKGVIVPLGGKFDRVGVGPIQVWERTDGRLEVISGRHRLDLARRSGETTIPAQVHKESEGFDVRQAVTLDAQLNIREEQGSVADYAQYFKDAGITKEAATELGLLARAKGRTGFAIARDASPDLLEAHRAGVLSDDAASAISTAAPGSDRLQALGMAMVNEGKSILVAVNTMKALDLMAAERMAAGAQGDIFGFDDSAMREAAAMGKRAASLQRKIGEQISAVSGASKRPELARKMGVDVADPEGIQKKIVELKQEQYLLDNWPLYPDLVAKLRGDLLKQGPVDDFSLKGETPAELKARDKEAAAQARRKQAEEAAGAKGPVLTADQVDLFNEQRTLFQSTPQGIFYSELGKQLDESKMKQAPAKGWKDLIRGMKGVKAEEVKWSGIEEWLDLQPGKVTKEQVADFIRGNGVQVKERMLGTDREAQYQAAKEEAAKFGITGDRFAQTWGKRNNWRAEEPGEEFPYSDTDVGRKLRDLIEPIVAQRDEQTKFGQYTLPGATEGTYRELLLTLPQKPPAARAELDAYVSSLVEKYGSTLNDTTLTNAERTKLRQLNMDTHTLSAPTFTSSHFDEPNILAHVRFNERTDAEGKRVLFLEELQSDWAQKGKKEGFSRREGALPNNLSVRKVNAEEADLYDLKEGDWALFDHPTEGEMIVRAGDPNITHAEAVRNALAEADDAGVDMGDLGGTTKGIPAAPFVGKTEAWVGLTLKRMIRYAAEHDLDRIAWTTGEQQVSRYTSALRNAVDAIEWKKTKEGIQLVGYKDGNARVTRDYQDMRERVHQIDLQINEAMGDRALSELTRRERGAIEALKEERYAISVELQTKPKGTKVVDTTEKEDVLSDAIGKAMADRIIKDPAQEGTIEGENIKIDDTGMASFYDRIVPNVAKDVLKKLGGGKIEEKPLAKGEGKALTAAEARDIAKGLIQGRLTVDEVNEEYNLGITADDVPRNDPYDRNNVSPLADAIREKTRPQKGTQQQGFEITPEMKAKALEGMPLFQQHRGSLQVAENLITLMQGADKSTIVHELYHSWLEEMKADASRPNAPEQIKADWEILRRELAIGDGGTIERASHEQFARIGERYLAEGEAPTRELQGVFERFKAWLLDIYKSLTALNVQINPELKGVLDRMIATDEEMAAAKDLGVPRAYVPEAKAQEARKIVPGFKAEQVSMEPYADELPKGPGQAPDDSHINYAYINTPTDVKLTMQRMAEIDQDWIQKQRGGTEGVKSWAEANAEQARYVNDILGGNEDTLRVLSERDPAAPGPDVKLGILKKLAVGAAKDSARLRDVVLTAGHDATLRQQLEYMGSIERARMIQAEFLGERAGVARALNALKDTTEGSGDIAKMLDAIGYGDEASRTLFQEPRTPAEEAALEQAKLKLALDEIMFRYRDKNGNLRTPLDIAKLHKEIGTLKGSIGFAKTLEKAGTWEMVVEGWKSGLLSGPVTHTTNLFGTGAFQVLRTPVEALATIIGMARGASPGMGESDRASMSEAVAGLTAYLGSALEGLKVGYHTFHMDEVTGKTESYRTAIPGRAGDLIRIPLRLMAAEDAIVNTMYTRKELAQVAIRTAFDEDLNPGTREFAERVDYLKDHPTPEMQVHADTQATRMTFNAPLGEKGAALQHFVNKWNLQWMIPFIRTPINIAKELGRMSPFAPVVGEWRAAMRQGGLERDRAIAEFTVGSGIMAVTMAYAFSGQISGAGSADPGKNRGKAGVWQPYSVNPTGDKWYEYGRIQPTGTLMGMAADLATVWDHMNDEEKDKVPKLLATAFANAVTNQTFLQGISNVVNAMSDPNRFGPRFLQQFAGSMVPNIVGQPTAMADPVVREVNSMLEAIQARIPGYRQDLLPKRDWLGEPQKTKERLGVVGPVREQQVSDDKVRTEAARLDISMAAAPKKTHIGKGTGKIGDVELTPEERNNFAKVGGEMAHQILGNIVSAPGYDEIPDLIKRRIFARVLSASHQVAAAAALPMEKRIAYIQSISEKVAAELAPAEE